MASTVDSRRVRAHIRLAVTLPVCETQYLVVGREPVLTVCADPEPEFLQSRDVVGSPALSCKRCRLAVGWDSVADGCYGPDRYEEYGICPTVHLGVPPG